MFGPWAELMALPEEDFSAKAAILAADVSRRSSNGSSHFNPLVAEGLEEGAVGCGISRADARQMVQAVLAGSAALLADGRDPALLRQQVSSPGGTTIAGLAELERGAVRSHLADAVRAAAARAAEL